MAGARIIKHLGSEWKETSVLVEEMLKQLFRGATLQG